MFVSHGVAFAHVKGSGSTYSYQQVINGTVVPPSN